MEENHPQKGQKVPEFGVSSEFPGVPLNSPEIQVEKRLLRNLAPWRGSTPIGADFWEGDATKHLSVKEKVFFQSPGGRHSVNEGFGKDFYRKDNSVKRSGPFGEPPDSEICKVAVLIPFPKISSCQRH